MVGCLTVLFAIQYSVQGVEVVIMWLASGRVSTPAELPLDSLMPTVSNDGTGILDKMSTSDT